MNFIQIYILIAVAIAGTSYFTLYKPSIELLEEIVERKTTYSGFILGVTWCLGAVIAAPLIATFLLKNDNEKFVEQFAVTLANRIIEDEDE